MNEKEKEVKRILIKILENSLSELRDEIYTQHRRESDEQRKADDVMTYLLRGLNGY